MRHKPYGGPSALFTLPILLVWWLVSLPFKLTLKSNKHTKKPSRASVRRAVASSTALATGQSVTELEDKLRHPSKKFSHITLAPKTNTKAYNYGYRLGRKL